MFIGIGFFFCPASSKQIWNFLRNLLNGIDDGIKTILGKGSFGQRVELFGLVNTQRTIGKNIL